MKAAELTTRVLLASGDQEPIEVGIVTTEIEVVGQYAELTFNARKWRRTMALAFLRMSWAAWTAGEEKHLTTDPACPHHREPHTWWQKRAYDRARGRTCPACTLAR